MRHPLVWRRAATAALVLLTAAPAVAAYEADRGSPQATGPDQGFSEIVDIEGYEERGEVHSTILTMLKDVGTALHTEHLTTHRELATLRDEVGRLREEVRRLSAAVTASRGGSQP